ncbi:hypothetical protein [Sinimarinibacterium sp. NLF-5-8]|uniref:hypothetical protein n=1 Tax=Sinimarinibacterium sp. NLF-5-8 TaxID=2698684 RepID=UPI00137BC11C|nr:hypothetical protein [Sinimarinibacterium sp. NLF-5-8]QHS09098.1 hypothetical protein GT972_02320 [Sinimarinibacterium sp. NLF-5-8]
MSLDPVQFVVWLFVLGLCAVLALAFALFVFLERRDRAKMRANSAHSLVENASGEIEVRAETPLRSRHRIRAPGYSKRTEYRAAAN